MIPPRLVWLLLGITLLASNALASEPMHTALTPVADDCQKWLAGRKYKTVCIAEIVGPRTYPTSAGPGIRLVMVELLRERHFDVKDRAPIAISISYRPRDVADGRDRDHKRLVVYLRVVFSDSRETELDDFETKIEHDEAVPIFLGTSLNRSGPADASAPVGEVVQFFEPKTHFDGTTVLAGEKSPFGLEVLVNGAPVPPQDRDGLAYTPLRREQEYTVRLVNRSEIEAAVRLSVDGLNVFTFCDEKQPATQSDGKPNPKRGEPLFDLFLVPAGGSVEVPGWMISRSKVLGFKVTSYPDTAGAQLGRDHSPTGTITATFSAAWEKGQKPPPGEPPTTRGPGDDGTGFGKPKAIDARPVERQVGVVRASVSVRYSSAK
jgi:hypothetical protein